MALTHRTQLILLCLLLTAWILLQWFGARPPAAAADWMGWRQADTQSIALNFRDSGNDILQPQINWRGSGPGFVEAEFQLYTYLIKLMLPAHGNTEWPGQLISLLSLALAILLVYRTLSYVYTPTYAALAALTAMASLGSLHLATAVQPDALCFLFYTAHLLCFYRFITGCGQHWLWVATALAILAVLIKPTALHLGIVQLVAIVFGARHLLKSPAVWFCWLLILASLAAYIGIAHQHYVQYGNTFGIGFGGDSKWPGMRDLLNPVNYYVLLRQSMTWGLGLAGSAAGFWLLVRRKLTAWEWALIAGNIASLIVSMRYSTSPWLGSHYHIFGVFLGSWLFAHALHDIAALAGKRIGWICAGLAALLVLQVTANTYRRINHPGIADGARFLSLATIAKKYTQPDDLVVVRSTASSYIDNWSGGINNFEDPRLFYLTQTKGWAMALDNDDISDLADMTIAGAKYYIHLGSFEQLPQTQRWLAHHAKLLAGNDHGAIYQLQPLDQLREK